MLITWDTIRVRRGRPLFEPSAFLFVGEIRKLQWAGNAMGLLLHRQTCFSCSNKMWTVVCLCVQEPSELLLTVSGWGSKLLFPNMRSISTTRCCVWPCSGPPVGSWRCPAVSMNAHTHADTHTRWISLLISCTSYCQTSFAGFNLSLVM